MGQLKKRGSAISANLYQTNSQYLWTTIHRSWSALGLFGGWPYFFADILPIWLVVLAVLGASNFPVLFWGGFGCTFVWVDRKTRLYWGLVSSLVGYRVNYFNDWIGPIFCVRDLWYNRQMLSINKILKLKLVANLIPMKFFWILVICRHSIPSSLRIIEKPIDKNSLILAGLVFY